MAAASGAAARRRSALREKGAMHRIDDDVLDMAAGQAAKAAASRRDRPLRRPSTPGRNFRPATACCARQASGIGKSMATISRCGA